MRNIFFITAPFRHLIVFMLCVVGVYISHTTEANAQTGNYWLTPISFPSPRTSLSTTADMRLSSIPQYPRPQSSVTVSIDTSGSFIALGNATIRWFIDDVEQKNSANQRQLTLTTGALGSDIKIKAVLVTAEGTTYQALKRIIPGDVDIIVEPRTYVPAFYKGRAQPSTNATLRLVAIPLLYTAGKLLPADRVSFTWSINGKIAGGGAQLGKKDIVVTVPFVGDLDVLVTATSQDGTRTAQRAERIRSAEPKILIYEDSTLYGVQPISRNAYLVPKDEITFRAEPYYLPDNSTVHYAWEVNGKSMGSASPNNRSITLEKNGASLAPSSVAVTLQNLGALARTIRKTFTVEFTDAEFIAL